MAKKKIWLSKLKRFFVTETHSKPEKEKKRRLSLQRLKINRLASLAPPPPLPSPLLETTQDQADDEPRKRDVTVAIATAAAAEAAVTAAYAYAAADVVRITGTPQSVHQCEDGTQESSVVDQLSPLQFIHQYKREIQEVAAIKIQTAFRGHLARKALRALKGLVKLQAIIRGRAVRRQAITTLKCLQTMVSIQSQVCARRSQTLEETCECHDNKQWQDLRDKEMKIESTNQRRWDDSILTKEEANALFLSKKEALLKRERIKEYALSNRKSTEQEQNKANLRFWLEQWVDTQLSKREDLEDINSVLSSNPRTKDYERKQLKYSTSCHRQYRLDGLVSPISVPRRSFHQKKQFSVGHDDKSSLPSSPGIVPTYMAATESAKAKARSMSSPKLRPLSFDTFSECNSPYKNKLSVISPVTSEVTSSGRIGKVDGFHYRSPSLKGIPGPLKSSRTLKDLSFDSECSFQNWDRYNSFR